MVIGGILLVGLVLAVVYFYLIKEKGEEGEELRDITCGCYMIDPAITSECGDPKRAFLFNLNTVSSDEVCNANCDINDVADNLLNSTTPRESYKSCTLRNIPDTRCENMILRDQNDKIITGRVQPEDIITAEATFDKSTYKDYSFSINNITEPPDRIDGNKIIKEISNFEGLTSIEILATAQTEQGEPIVTIVCRRVVELESSISSAVTGMTALTEQQADGKTKISKILISVGALESENIKITFSFSSGYPTLTAEDGIIYEAARGGISMSKLDLYDEAYFSQNSFNILNNHVGELEITAEVFVNNQSIGTANTKVTFRDISSELEEPEEPKEPPAIVEKPPVVKDEPPTSSEVASSNFTVSKASSQSCLERVSPNNSTTFTITVTNNRTEVASDTTPDEIQFIKDKLPIGFVYTPESTLINGTASPDSGLVTVTSIGNTQEIMWKPSSSWIVEQGKTFTISFDSTVTSNSVTGQHNNEVIVNPKEVPLHPNSLRSQTQIIVAQDCENITDEERKDVPATGIFDSFTSRILLGVILLIIGWTIYVRPEGNTLSKYIINTKTYSTFEMIKYKITNPKRYFEEKIIRKKPKES